ncbi:MAG: hypothetical protein Q4C01_06905 [Clostridia bacterium]|nr:hypothetical protein [Clostridia bacterium]
MERMKRDEETIAELNRIYRRLEQKQIELARKLFHRIFRIESQYYSGHFRRTESGQLKENDYPIPIISIKGLCDIEIDLDCISVYTTLRRQAALAYSFEKLKAYRFEASTTKRYLSDLYCEGSTIEQMKAALAESSEKEVNFLFTFDFDTDGETMLNFAKLLRREGFYY